MNEKKWSGFFKSFFFVSLSTFLTRGIIFLNYTFFSHTPKLTTEITSNKFTFHHYLFGFLLIILGSSNRKVRYFKYIILVGTGIVIEEWTVLIENLGIVHSIRYFSAFDIPLGLLIFTLLYLIAVRIRNKF